LRAPSGRFIEEQFPQPRVRKRSSHGVLSSGYETSKKREPVPSKEREFVSI
jgi:hypothetical protein